MTLMRYANILMIVAMLATCAFGQDGKTITAEQAWKLGWPAMQGPRGNFSAPPTGAASNPCPGCRTLSHGWC